MLLMPSIDAENFRLPKGSLSQMYFKIGVLKNFPKLTGKNLC